MSAFDPDGLARDVLARARGRQRYIVAIAGAPGAGKSTFADALLSALLRHASGRAGIVPMDGYHLDNAVLSERGLLARKGAPETFDVGGFAADLGRLRYGSEAVAVPVFDRPLDLARAGGRIIGPEHAIVLVEGNYLLLDKAPWQALDEFFDYTVFLDVPEDLLRERLTNRWLLHGFDRRAAEARARQNDLPNASLVTARSRHPDLVLSERGRRNDK